MPTTLHRPRGLAIGAAALALALAVARRDDAAPPADAASGLAAFETVRKVFQHPRCQNCHIPGDAPLQLDEGRTHAQNVKRGLDGQGVPGLPCATCHTSGNPPASYGASMPPGAPNWHLPPARTPMVFIDLTPAQLCATVKDAKATGGKDLAAMLDHVANDRLVAWGWDPGVGRAAVPVPRPEVVAAFRTWMDAGAPCPAR
jgi:mono/diheme cytochrome c family protein